MTPLFPDFQPSIDSRNICIQWLAVKGFLSTVQCLTIGRSMRFGVDSNNSSGMVCWFRWKFPVKPSAQQQSKTEFSSCLLVESLNTTVNICCYSWLPFNLILTKKFLRQIKISLVEIFLLFLRFSRSR
jgi:hypothetical protein